MFVWSLGPLNSTYHQGVDLDLDKFNLSEACGSVIFWYPGLWRGSIDRGPQNTLQHIVIVIVGAPKKTNSHVGILDLRPTWTPKASKLLALCAHLKGSEPK